MPMPMLCHVQDWEATTSRAPPPPPALTTSSPLAANPLSTSPSAFEVEENITSSTTCSMEEMLAPTNTASITEVVEEHTYDEREEDVVTSTPHSLVTGQRRPREKEEIIGDGEEEEAEAATEAASIRKMELQIERGKKLMAAIAASLVEKRKKAGIVAVSSPSSSVEEKTSTISENIENPEKTNTAQQKSGISDTAQHHHQSERYNSDHQNNNSCNSMLNRGDKGCYDSIEVANQVLEILQPHSPHNVCIDNTIKHLPPWEWQVHPILVTIQAEIRSLQVEAGKYETERTLELNRICARAAVLLAHKDRSTPLWIAECWNMILDCAVLIWVARLPSIGRCVVNATLHNFVDEYDRRLLFTTDGTRGKSIWSSICDRVLKELKQISSANRTLENQRAKEEALVTNTFLENRGTKLPLGETQTEEAPEPSKLIESNEPSVPLKSLLEKAIDPLLVAEEISVEDRQLADTGLSKSPLEEAPKPLVDASVQTSEEDQQIVSKRKFQKGKFPLTEREVEHLKLKAKWKQQRQLQRKITATQEEEQKLKRMLALTKWQLKSIPMTFQQKKNSQHFGGKFGGFENYQRNYSSFPHPQQMRSHQPSTTTTNFEGNSAAADYEFWDDAAPTREEYDYYYDNDDDDDLHFTSTHFPNLSREVEEEIVKPFYKPFSFEEETKLPVGEKECDVSSSSSNITAAKEACSSSSSSSSVVSTTKTSITPVIMQKETSSADTKTITPVRAAKETCSSVLKESYQKEESYLVASNKRTIFDENDKKQKEDPPKYYNTKSSSTPAPKATTTASPLQVRKSFLSPPSFGKKKSFADTLLAGLQDYERPTTAKGMTTALFPPTPPLFKDKPVPQKTTKIRSHRNSKN